MPQDKSPRGVSEHPVSYLLVPSEVVKEENLSSFQDKTSATLGTVIVSSNSFPDLISAVSPSCQRGNRHPPITDLIYVADHVVLVPIAVEIDSGMSSSPLVLQHNQTITKDTV